ncbi:response regulator [Cupriavidus basilensis]|uniref:response regulator n=1 Tax=Cupriavidus basilensis TaxID=68895 RepID=UPI0039F68B72
MVDDEPGVTEGLACALEQEGYAVEQAVDGLSAFAAAQRVHPSVVVTDWVMPHADGAMLCKLLLREPGLSATPIVISTSCKLQPVIANPTVRYCPKPCLPNDVVRAVHDLLGDKALPCV